MNTHTGAKVADGAVRKYIIHIHKYVYTCNIYIYIHKCVYISRGVIGAAYAAAGAAVAVGAVRIYIYICICICICIYINN